MDHPILLVPQLDAWSSHSECPSLTRLHPGWRLHLLDTSQKIQNEKRPSQNRPVLGQCCTSKGQIQVVFLFSEATVHMCLGTYVLGELTRSSCVFLCQSSSHECLQEQKEAHWSRKESNVWERGSYLLPFDLLWSQNVLGCRTDLQSLMLWDV